MSLTCSSARKTVDLSAMGNLAPRKTCAIVGGCGGWPVIWPGVDRESTLGSAREVLVIPSAARDLLFALPRPAQQVPRCARDDMICGKMDAMWTAITRDISSSLADCELSYVSRTPIDIGLA